MRQIFTIVLALMLGCGAASACVKKFGQPSIPSGQPLTVIVMDTTQALLPAAQVKIGKDIYTTSFDGRIVLRPEQITSGALVVTCEGHKASGSLPISHNPMIVQLIPLRPKAEHPGFRSVGSRRAGAGEVVYALSATSGAARMKDASVPAAAVDHMAADYVAVEEAAVAGNTMTAGKLTAGEVNDFAKWSFWPTILDSTHKQFIGTWRMAPRERYTVAVTDKHGYPIVNYPVSLTDQDGNTVFQALTDNTGKAELWANLVNEGVKELKSEGVKAPEQSLVVDMPCEPTDLVDVCFVFDATGSMGDELRYLQTEMKDVIARASAATGGLKIRTGAVVYRDHGDDYITRLSRLTDDITATQAFIDKQEANGGGDYPEAVPEALMAALNSAGWDETARARILFLVLDAPCHDDSATLALLHEQVLNAAALGVRIVPVVCSGIGESGEYLLRAVALATNGTSFFLTDDSGIGHTHLKPTTDSLTVEHLNDMLVRTIVEFSYMPDCQGRWHEDEISNVREEFIPNPFDAEELAKDPSIPHGPTTLYLLDVSGKLITTYEGLLDEAGDSQLARLHLWLPTGIYFVKAFYDGQWHTKKILVH